MPLELIGAGFGRTGTYSIQTALNILYESDGKKCYHFGEILQRPDHARLWTSYLNKKMMNGNKTKKSNDDNNKNNSQVEQKQEEEEEGYNDNDDNKEGEEEKDETAIAEMDWEEQLFGPEGYVATQDHPCANVWEDLWRAYPNAKILLSKHPGGYEKWYESKMAHQELFDAVSRWPMKPVIQLVVPILRRLLFPRWKNSLTIDEIKQLDKATEGHMWGVGEGEQQQQQRRGIYNAENVFNIYNNFYNHVKKTVPAENLLEYDVTMGWEPLCKFIGKPIPINQPFPKEDSHSSKNIISTIQRLERIIWFSYGTFSALALYGLRQVVVFWKCSSYHE